MSCEWLTPKEAAAKAKVSTAAIYRWIREDNLPYAKTPGGRIRICSSDIIKEVGYNQ